MKEKLLKILKVSRGEYVSGEEISKKLKVTRTAVWKHIGGLRAEGYKIDSSPRLGYLLVSVPDLLLPAELQEGLDTAVLGKKIYYQAETDSTNRLARQLAQDGEPEGSIVLAEVQREGRGRLGRHWSSPQGGIWLSLILRPQIAPYEAQLLTLAAAVAAVEATRVVGGIEPGIKWPNDLLIREGKVAGILTEVSAEMERVNYLILGVGVNANFSADSFPDELKKTAATLLEQSGHPVDRAAWVRTFLVNMEKLYLDSLSVGFGRVLELWRSYSVTLGRGVSIRLTDRTVEGVALDIDDKGALVVKTAAGVETFLAGDVTLRPSMGRV